MLYLIVCDVRRICIWIVNSYDSRVTQVYSAIGRVLGHFFSKVFSHLDAIAMRAQIQSDWFALLQTDRGELGDFGRRATPAAL